VLRRGKIGEGIGFQDAGIAMEKSGSRLPHSWLLLTYNAQRNTLNVMIKSFVCKDTQTLFEGSNPRRSRAPPGNRLEALRGDRKGQWSVRVNDQWCICFKFRNGDVFDVKIVDYH